MSILKQHAPHAHATRQTEHESPCTRHVEQIMSLHLAVQRRMPERPQTKAQPGVLRRRVRRELLYVRVLPGCTGGASLDILPTRRTAGSQRRMGAPRAARWGEKRTRRARRGPSRVTGAVWGRRGERARAESARAIQTSRRTGGPSRRRRASVRSRRRGASTGCGVGLTRGTLAGAARRADAAGGRATVAELDDTQFAAPSKSDTYFSGTYM